MTIVEEKSALDRMLIVLPEIKLELDAETDVKTDTCSKAREALSLSLSVLKAFGRGSVHLSFCRGSLEPGFHHCYG